MKRARSAAHPDSEARSGIRTKLFLERNDFVAKNERGVLEDVGNRRVDFLADRVVLSFQINKRDHIFKQPPRGRSPVSFQLPPAGRDSSSKQLPPRGSAPPVTPCSHR